MGRPMNLAQLAAICGPILVDLENHDALGQIFKEFFSWNSTLIMQALPDTGN